MFPDHGMGPAGGSRHPWGVPDGSHVVIYGLFFDVATDLYVKMAQNDPKWPKIGRNRQQKTPILRSALVLKFAPLKVVWGLFDTEKKLYMCPFGPEPIAGTKMQEHFPGLLLLRCAERFFLLHRAVKMFSTTTQRCETVDIKFNET